MRIRYQRQALLSFPGRQTRGSSEGPPPGSTRCLRESKTNFLDRYTNRRAIPHADLCQWIRVDPAWQRIIMATLVSLSQSSRVSGFTRRHSSSERNHIYNPHRPPLRLRQSLVPVVTRELQHRSTVETCRMTLIKEAGISNRLPTRLHLLPPQLRPRPTRTTTQISRLWPQG